MKILVVAGSGGIGLALIKQLLLTYSDAEILATFNSTQPNFEHHQLTWQSLNLSSELQIQQLAQQCPRLDLLINAAGILHDTEHLPEKSITEFDSSFFLKNIHINCQSTILLAKYFAAALKQSHMSYFVALSARIGSISDNHLGGWISYRASKAALNMAIKTISIEWRRGLPQCCLFVFHPGTTDTDLSKPFQRNIPQNQLQSVEFTANALIEKIKSVRITDSGKFFSYDGQEIAW